MQRNDMPNHFHNHILTSTYINRALSADLSGTALATVEALVDAVVGKALDDAAADSTTPSTKQAAEGGNTFGYMGGKWCWEWQVVGCASGNVGVGVCTSRASLQVRVFLLYIDTYIYNIYCLVVCVWMGGWRVGRHCQRHQHIPSTHHHRRPWARTRRAGRTTPPRSCCTRGTRARRAGRTGRGRRRRLAPGTWLAWSWTCTRARCASSRTTGAAVLLAGFVYRYIYACRGRRDVACLGMVECGRGVVPCILIYLIYSPHPH